MVREKLPCNLLVSICFYCFLLPTIALGQSSNRTPIQSVPIVLNGQRLIVKWLFEIPVGSGIIRAQDNGYFIDSPKDYKSLRPRIHFVSIPDSVTIITSREWSLPNSTMHVRGTTDCLKRRWYDPTRIVQLESTGVPGEVNIRCRLVQGGNPSCDAEGADFNVFIRLTGTEILLEPAITDTANDKTLNELAIDTAIGKGGTNTILNNVEVVSGPDVDQATTTEQPSTQANPSYNPPVEAAPREKTADELAFEAARKENTLPAFLAYIAAYKKGRFIKEAKLEVAKKQKIAVAKIDDTETGRFTVELLNVTEPEIKVISNTLIEAEIVRNRNHILEHRAVLNVKLPPGYEKDVLISLFDPIKDTIGDPYPVDHRLAELSLGDHLKPIVYIDEEATPIVKIHFSQGQPPYQIYFEVNGEVKIIESGVNDTVWVPPTDDFFKDVIGKKIAIEITDERQSTPLANPDWQFTVPDRRLSYTLWYMIGATILLGLLFVAWPMAQARNRNRRRQEYTTKRLEKWQGHMDRIQAERASLLIEDGAILVEEGGNEFEEQLEEGIAKRSSGIRIKKVTKASDRVKFQDDPKELEKILKTGYSAIFEMATFWEDSAIELVIFTSNAQEQLDEFLHLENLRPLQEQEGQIPEIGGILMGRVFLGDNGKFRVLTEEFVPIAPEYHDTYQLEFSADSLARDLGQAQDQHPDLTLVGWFHTHPGHGLFLSRPDLRIHDTFFKKGYQYAMEIDSLTERLDTGFFTRMQNGKVNNRRNLRLGAEWYSWIEMEHSN